MIDALDETIRQLVVAEMPVRNDEIDISFDQPKREWSARLNRPTLNFYLYNLRENQALRNQQWERLPGNGQDGLAHLKRSPYRLDCFYMITAWAAEPEDEHRLLSRCLAALFRYPVLPESRLVGALQNQPYELQSRLGSSEQLSNPAELWSALDNEMRPSIPYMITIALDPWREVDEPLVHTVRFRHGQAIGLPRRQQLWEEAQPAEWIAIGGMVRSKGKDNTPLAGIEVAVKGTGLFDTTDEEGHFRLGRLPAGDYTLVAWPTEGKPQERRVTIPAEEGNYDILL